MKILIRKKFGPCPECKTSLLHYCLKNGVRVVIGTEENPVQVWNADLYLCPECKAAVLTDFGKRAEWNTKNTPDLAGLLAKMRRHGDMIVYNGFPGQILKTEQKCLSS